jgi:hypothetical protein
LILDAETHEHKLKDLDFNFIELPKFNKTEQELQTLVDKWVYFIKNAANLTVIPPDLGDEGLQSAYTEADQYGWKKEDLEAYECAKMREADDINREKFVVEKAKLSTQLGIAKNLISLGLDNETIAKATDLIEDITNPFDSITVKSLTANLTHGYIYNNEDRLVFEADRFNSVETIAYTVSDKQYDVSGTLTINIGDI